MDGLDMVIFICMFAAAAIGALLIFHLIGVLYLRVREWRIIKRRFGGVEPYWWR